MMFIFLCAFLQPLFAGPKASPDLEQLEELLNDPKQLEELLNDPEQLEELLNNAKQKQLSVSNVEWLDKVKERLYEAESVIENINTKDSGLELEKCQIQKQSKVPRQRLEVVTDEKKINTGALGCKKIQVESGNKDEGQESINVPCISQVNNRSGGGVFPHCTLEDFVLICHSQNLPVSGNEDRLVQLKEKIRHIKLTDQHGRPTSVLVRIMKDMAFRLVELQKLGKFLSDLKPQSVLIKKIPRKFYAELSDHQYTGCKTEDLIFNLGCVFFFGLTGKHYIDHKYHCDREANNVENKGDLFLLVDFAEAYDLIFRLVSSDPKLRPTAIEVLDHPLLWKSGKRLSFLCETSDLLRGYPHLLKVLEATKIEDLGGKNWKGKLATTWNQPIGGGVINHMLKYKNYDYKKVSGLLRFIRNTWSHYNDFPEYIKALMIGVEKREDLDAFFTSRFPKLLMVVYNSVCSTQCKEEKCFKEYFKAKGNVDTS